MFRLAAVAALALISGSEAVHLQSMKGRAGKLAQGRGRLAEVEEGKNGRLAQAEEGKNGRLAEMGGPGRLAENGRSGRLAETEGRRLAETEGRRGRKKLPQGRLNAQMGRSGRLAELLATKGPSADDIMEMFDHNGDGEISKEEFKDQLLEIARDHDYEPTEEDKKQAMKMFRMADQDKSGSVSREELLDAMEAVRD